MDETQPRQVMILSIAKADDDTDGTAIIDTARQALCEMIDTLSIGPHHTSSLRDNSLLLKFDNTLQDDFLSYLRQVRAACDQLRLKDTDTPLTIRVGAFTENSMHEFVNDAADVLLSYMGHYDCSASLLFGDEEDDWGEIDLEGITPLTHSQLKYLDPFTGMLQAPRFLSLLQEVIDTGAGFDGTVAVLYFDIDDFKSFNRTFDHGAGNKLLLYVAGQIRKVFDTDVVAHLSVDRFAVLTNSNDIALKCATIHEATRGFSPSFRPEIKCGIYLLDDTTRSANVSLDCAKMACESIKGRYDIAFRFFGEDLRERMFLRRYVAHHAEEAVRDGWVHAFAQVVVDTVTEEPCGFEALARWQDPEYGLLSPAVFIPTLEDAHLIHKLDGCILDQVCEHLAKRIAAGEPCVPASINLSRLDFSLTDILLMINESCERWGVPHNMISIEITESALDGDDNLKEMMGKLRNAGFEVWMDDFGCGYSSLNLLKDYEFDVLKVDMEFLRDMERNERSKTIVASVIEMAKSLGIRTLVEGVETAAQRDFLRSAGCDMMQGYYFGRPQPLPSLAW